MKLETFFKKFELFSEAPDAVARMRELVLELAVRGELTEQVNGDLNDALWHALTSRLDERSKGNGLSNDIPFDLPNTWRWVTLNDLGQTKPRNDVPDTTTVSFVPMALVPAEFGNNVQHELRQWDEIKKGYTHFADGDVVMAKITPCYENGKSAVIEQLTGRVGAGTTELHVFRPTSQVIQAKYVLIYFKSRGFIERGIPRMTGSAGQKRVPHDYFSKSPFPLPPPAEQKRIVAKVDELMALCDRLEAQQQECETRHAALARAALAHFAESPSPANLDFLFHKSYAITPADLRKTILTLAVQGKLVPQMPFDGDAREMIDRAMASRRQTIRSSSVRRNELDKPADLIGTYDLPSSWCVERLVNLVDPENSISYGVLVPGNDVRGGIPFVRAQDLCLSNQPSRPNKAIAPDIEKPYARTRLTGGEILLCVVGSIGKLGIAPDSWAGANIARAVARIKAIPQVLRDYLLLVLQEDTVQTYFTSTTRTLAQPTLNVGMIERTLIPVPPLAEQRRIVAKVDQLMALVYQLEAQLAASRAAGEELMKALVAELTTQINGVASQAPQADDHMPAQTALNSPTQPCVDAM